MQLIFETQPTEDIQTKMSTQAESLINGDISDINIENKITDKENKLTFNDLSKDLKEINRYTSEVMKETIVKEESKTNGNDNGDLETIEDVKECDLLENINNIIGENSTIGVNIRQEQKSVTECKNLEGDVSVRFIDPANGSNKDCLKVNSEKIASEHVPEVPSIENNSNTGNEQAKKSSLKNYYDLEAFVSTNTNKMMDDSETMNEDKNRDLIIKNDTNVSISIDATENVILMDKDTEGCLESPGDDLTSNETDRLLLVYESSPSKDVEDLADDANDLEANVSANGPSFEPSINKEKHPENATLDKELVKPLELEDVNPINDNEECKNRDRISASGTSSCTDDNTSIHKEKDKSSLVLEDNESSADGNSDEFSLVYDTSPPNNFEVMNGEKDKPTNLLADNDNSSEASTKELSLVHETTPASDVNLMAEEIDKPSHLPEENSPESNTDELSLVYDTSPTNAIKHPEDISMNEEFQKSSIINANNSTIETVNILSKETVLENILLETAHVKNSEDILIEAEVIKLVEIPADVVINDEPITNDVAGHTIEVMNETIDKPIVMDENKILPIEDTAMMEIPDISIDEPINDNDDNVNKDNIEKGEGQCLENSTNDESGIKSDACAEKELVNAEKEAENVPMEVDDDKIVDLDKDNQERSVSKTKTSSNDAVDSKKNYELKDNSGDIINATATETVETKSQDCIENINTEIPVQRGVEEVIQNDHDKVEIVDEDDIKIIENKEDEAPSEKEKAKPIEPKETKTLPVVCKLSNTLDILSDDEEEPSKEETNKPDRSPEEKQCIDIDDDDDIMFIEDDSNVKEATNENKTEDVKNVEPIQSKTDSNVDLETGEKETSASDVEVLSPKINEKDSLSVNDTIMELDTLSEPGKTTATETEKLDQKKPLLPQNFLKTAKKNLAEMTRDELEDFCILRIVESIVDRSNLSDIKTKIKTMGQNLEDYRKRAMMLTKQNRDLQVVLKSVQEEQKKRSHSLIQPLKITRSVGMQVLMNDKIDPRRKGPIPCQPSTAPVGRPARALQTKTTKPTPPTIPVPRKVPVNSPAKALTNTPNSNAKTTSPSPNGLRNPSPVHKAPEKRTHSRMQASSSVTVDLTDDEPPPKINNKNAPSPPVRVVPQQNLMAQQRFAQPLNSPRKVYIPISGPQAQNIRPGQTLVMRNVTPNGPRQRVPPMPRMQQSPIRINKPVAQISNRHPAPLPDAMKQYTPPTWKALPPAPDLKLSKVENGIVISWKIDGLDGGYETIASYQLYAYQETSAPPCTALWKKIGDVKALPLPMACTLTQFMAGFKYYFAVRAVDVRSRLGPFSLPGSILLLNKV